MRNFIAALPVILAACGSKPQDAIVGKWEGPGDVRVEFRKDGTMESIEGSRKPEVLKYSFPDDKHIKFEPLEERRGHDPFVLEMEIAGDFVKFVRSDGKGVYLRRAGSTAEWPAEWKTEIERAMRNAKVTQCVNNLRQLWTMQNNYMVQFGGRMKLMPTETGKDFWLKLTQTQPPLIDETMKDIFFCPVKGSTPVWGQTDYRGPSGNVNQYLDGDPVGADIDGNHGAGEGGNVLRKSADVQTVPANDALWGAAGNKTSP